MRITTILQLVTFTCLVTFVWGGCVIVSDSDLLSGDCIYGSGAIQSQKRTLSAFDSVRLLDSATVFVSQGNPQRVTIEAQENLLANLETDVSDDTMTIDARRCYRSNGPVNVYVTVPDVHAFIIEGSGYIVGQTTLVTDQLSLAIAGPGHTNLDVDTTAISTLIEGSGSTTLSGRADAQQAEIHGSGAVHALELITRTSDIIIEGSGDADVHATEALSAHISGSGSVRYQGAPEDTSFTIDGSGEIDTLE